MSEFQKSAVLAEAEAFLAGWTRLRRRWEELAREEAKVTRVRLGCTGDDPILEAALGARATEARRQRERVARVNNCHSGAILNRTEENTWPR